MADFILTLGGVDFRSFEIPECIRAGGAQSIEIHKFGGGERKIDAFGADDAPIGWSGIFFDETAEARCQQLDAMRKKGAPLDLSWSSFSYQVVIRSFTFEYRRFYEIEYWIELEVIADNTQPVTDTGADDVEGELQDDYADSNSYASELNDPALNADMLSIGNDVGGLPSISAGSVAQLTLLSGDVGLAGFDATALVTGFDGQVDQYGAPGLFAGGVSPVSLIANITRLGNSSAKLPNAFSAANSLARLGLNIGSILSGR